MQLDVPKPYRLLLKGDTQPMALDENKFTQVHRWYHNAGPSEVLDLRNDAGRYVATIRKGDVARLYSAQHSLREHTTTEGQRYNCSYGESHGASAVCECAKTYGYISPEKFQEILRAKGFPVITDGFMGQQITNLTLQMRQYVKQWLRDNPPMQG